MRTRISIVLAVAAALAVAAPASASTAGDVRAGQALANQLDAGKTSCAKLGDDDFENLGTYVMGRMAGSAALLDAMTQRMRSVMGSDNQKRMEVLMGRRFAGCGAVAGPMGWMRDGTWRHMTRADWQQVSDEWMGPGMMGRRTGWWTGGHVALVVGLVALAGLAGGLIASAAARRRAP